MIKIERNVNKVSILDCVGSRDVLMFEAFGLNKRGYLPMMGGLRKLKRGLGECYEALEYNLIPLKVLIGDFVLSLLKLKLLAING